MSTAHAQNRSRDLDKLENLFIYLFIYLFISKISPTGNAH